MAKTFVESVASKAKRKERTKEMSSYIEKVTWISTLSFEAFVMDNNQVQELALRKKKSDLIEKKKDTILLPI